MSNTDVYAVFKYGVYRHECAGVYASLDDAKLAATKAREADKDQYHGYEVVPFELGKMTEQEPLKHAEGWQGATYVSGGGLIERKAVFKVEGRV